MNPTLDLGSAVSPDRTILTVSGELDMDTAPHLTAAADALDLPGQTLVLDLSTVTFIDSSGLNALLALRHRVNVADGALELIGLCEQALHLLDLTGTRGLFTLRPES
ncbi:STAS domain-containing protein [Streptomyces erythrochromogenes]|uniref:Anti-sigma factor antagonist n=1 Tax=Streptomyces erythrochromogenes TaxID=285574 RepID=A0ABZ1Q3D8_9ACTN|nr:STAS domain-containing protein [Streptomyces erythrochromogenes]MCX5584004.1 STAS domain-containing protein [Streptomyces erythrochromogenes]